MKFIFCRSLLRVRDPITYANNFFVHAVWREGRAGNGGEGKEGSVRSRSQNDANNPQVIERNRFMMASLHLKASHKLRKKYT